MSGSETEALMTEVTKHIAAFLSIIYSLLAPRVTDGFPTLTSRTLLERETQGDLARACSRLPPRRPPWTHFRLRLDTTGYTYKIFV